MNQLDEPTINNEEIFETVAKKGPIRMTFAKLAKIK